jgi:hypothetical protein
MLDLDIALMIIPRQRLRLSDASSTRDDIEARLIRHGETLALNGSLLGYLGLVELAVRNSACHCLDETHGSRRWLQAQGGPIRWRDHERSSLKHAADRAGFTSGQIHSGDLTDPIVTNLSFGFWKSLYSPSYEEFLWYPALRSLFPARSVTREVVAEQLHTINQARNRVAHLEILDHRRWRELRKSVDFLVDALAIRGRPCSGTLRLLLAPHEHEVERRIANLEFRSSLNAGSGASP